MSWGLADRVLALLLVVALLAAAVPTTLVVQGGKVSQPGVYGGYSEALYDGYQRSSRYVEVRDGTRLAVDIFRPARAGVLHADRLPVVWSAERYRRADVNETVNGSRLVTTLELYPYLTTLLHHGYVVAAVDVRATAPPTGLPGGTDMTEAHDLYDMTGWFAASRGAAAASGCMAPRTAGTTSTGRL